MLAYLYAVFDLPSITWVCLVAIILLPKTFIDRLLIDRFTKALIWHYYGVLSVAVVLSYLLGYTALYELGYHYGALVFLLPLMVFSIYQRNLVIATLVALQVLIWLVAVHSYINLFDVLVGELLLICYIGLLGYQWVRRLIMALKTLVRRDS